MNVIGSDSKKYTIHVETDSKAEYTYLMSVIESFEEMKRDLEYERHSELMKFKGHPSLLEIQ